MEASTSGQDQVSINLTQEWKGADGAMLSQTVNVVGLYNEEALIVLDKWQTGERLENRDNTRVLAKDAFRYPPGSRYGAGVGGAIEIGGIEGGAPDGPGEPQESDGESAEANALTDDESSPPGISDFLKGLDEITRDGSVTVRRSDDGITAEICLADRKITLSDDQIRRLRDALGTAEAHALREDDGPEGAEIVVPTGTGWEAAPIGIRAVAPADDDPATITHPKDASSQSSVNGLIAFMGLNAVAQILNDITIAFQFPR